MARYTIDFTTNASRIVREIEEVNRKVAQVARTGKSVKITLDAAPLQASLDATFRQLDNQIARMQRKLANLPIGSRKFQQQATALGITEGTRQRGGMQASAIQLGAQAEAFDIGSVQRLQKQLEAARIEASQISPNTPEWIAFQRQIGQINTQLKATDRLAESIQMQESLGAFAPGSLNALDAKLTVLRNRAREISPSGETLREWKKLNNAILETERSIEKQTRRPLTGGQRLGAAGGAFLYGGGLGGGVGSAVGGIAGGLMGGVPGAFTGAAIGQAVDNLGGMAAGVTKAAATIQQLQRGLALASIDAKDFGEAQQAIADSSNKLVVPIEQVYRQFTQLRVNTKQYGLTVEDTKEILEGVVLAVSSVGGSMEDVDGAMRAVVQIFSKGSVQAEELRGQLGERFPGAVVKFAQANKMSFEELQDNLQQGKVTVGDFVEFAKKNYKDYADFTEQIATAPEFAGRRLEKAMNDMQIAIGSALGPAGAEFQDFFTETIQGFTNWVNENKDFIKEYISDWAKLALDFARIVRGIAKVVVEISTSIVKAFRGAIYEIRRLLGMVGVAEIKAQIDKLDARILAGESGGSRRGAAPGNRALELKRERLQAQFEAAGGQAALDATAPALTFGGPGAGMNLDATGGKGEKEKATRLQAYNSKAIELLRARLREETLAIEVNDQLSARQKELMKASMEYEYGLKIIKEQLQEVRKEKGKMSEADAALAMAEANQTAEIEKSSLKHEYNKAVFGSLFGITEDYEKKIQEVTSQINALNTAEGELTTVQQAELLLAEQLRDVDEKDIGITESKRKKIIELAAELDRLLGIEKDIRKERELAQALEDKRTEVGMIGAGLMAGYAGPAANVFERTMIETKGNVDYARQMADLETAAMQMRSVFEGIQGAIDGISGAFASMMTEGVTALVTGTATAKEVFASFLQSVAQALQQAAAQMIATYVAIGIAKMFAGLGGAASAKGSGGGVNVNPATNTIQPLGPSVSGLQAAKGAYFNSGMSYFATGGIVSSPTFFQFADGGKINMGLMGEAGPEAIMPLKRGPDGRLGISMYDASRKAVANAESNAGISSIDYEDEASIGGASSSRQSLSSKAAQAVMATRLQVMEQRSLSEKRSEMRQIEEMVAAPTKINVEYQSQVINNVEYVTREQAERMASQSALRGRELAIGALQNSVKVRKRVGMG